MPSLANVRGKRVGFGDGISPKQMRWLVSGLMIGLFMSSTEQSVIATALPTMAGELGGANRLAWVVSAYLLTSTVVTPLYGKLSDLFGRRNVYQMSILIFAGGSLLCGLAQTMNQLVAARAVQGVGGGGLMSLAFVVLGDVVSPRERGRYIGVFTAVFTFSAVTGPLWGGLLVDTIGWRWIFFIMLPICAVGLAITEIGLRLPFETRDAKIDWMGGGLLIVSATALILVPIWGGRTFGWSSPELIATGGIGILFMIVFLVQEARTEEAILPPRLFRDRTVNAVFGMGFGLMFALIATSTFMPLFLQIATGASATKSGLLMTPQSVGISVVATVAGALVSKFGRYKWTLLLGPVLAASGLAFLSTIGPDTTALQLAPYLFLTGVGIGLVFPNMTLAVQNAADMRDIGVVTSSANFFRSMGGAFGAAIAGSVLSSRLESGLESRLSPARFAEVGGADGLIRSPKVVQGLDEDLRIAAVEAVTGAVTGVLYMLVPIIILVGILALFVKEKPLRQTSAMGAEKEKVQAEPLAEPGENGHESAPAGEPRLIPARSVDVDQRSDALAER